MTSKTKKSGGATGGVKPARPLIKKRQKTITAPAAEKPKGKLIRRSVTPAAADQITASGKKLILPERKSFLQPPSSELTEIMGLLNNKNPKSVRPVTSGRLTYGRNSTGILSLDICLVGGFMNSRIAMVYGERSAGKSTVSTRALASALRNNQDQYAVIVDVEGTVDRQWLRVNGVDLDRLIIAEPPTGEDAVDQLDALVRTEGVCFVVLDSIAMITPLKEIESSAEDQQIGVQARLIGKMLRRVNSGILSERVRDRYPGVILLNQIRMKAGMVFGDPRTLPGGKALEFVTSQQVEMKNKEVRDEKTGIIKYNDHTAIITKDKTGGRYKEAKFRLIRDEGQNLPVGYILQTKDILDHGLRCGFVEGRIRIDGIPHKFSKADEVTEYFIENPAQEELLRSRIVEHYRQAWGIE